MNEPLEVETQWLLMSLFLLMFVLFFVWIDKLH